MLLAADQRRQRIAGGAPGERRCRGSSSGRGAARGRRARPTPAAPPPARRRAARGLNGARWRWSSAPCPPAPASLPSVWSIARDSASRHWPDPLERGAGSDRHPDLDATRARRRPADPRRRGARGRRGGGGPGRARRGPGPTSMQTHVGRSGAATPAVHGCSSTAPSLASQASAAAESGTRCSAPPSSRQRLSHDGARFGTVVRQVPGVVDAVRELAAVDRPSGEVGEHRRRHRRVVADEVALRQRLAAAAAGEDDLVEVGEVQLVLAERPPPGPAEVVQGGQLVVRSARPSWPSRSSWPPARRAPRRWCGPTSPIEGGPRGSSRPRRRRRAS